VLFQVAAAGKSYDEMHGDGGVMTQVFGAIFLDRLMQLSGHNKGQLFIIEFDPAYMKALFDVGDNQGRNGTEWVKVPPIYKEMDQ
jgi:hypothetical protein